MDQTGQILLLSAADGMGHRHAGTDGQTDKQRDPESAYYRQPGPVKNRFLGIIDSDKRLLRLYIRIRPKAQAFHPSIH